MSKVLRAMVAPEVPALLKRMGIAGHAVHRLDPGDPLEAALHDEDRALRLQALRAVGELAATRLADQLKPHMTGDDPEARFWASQSAALLGQRAGVMGLQRFAEVDDGPLGERAAQLAACLLEPEPAMSWITGLDAAGRRRMALIGAATAGHPALLPWIATCMQEEEHARRAGNAFYAITGVPIDDELEADAPEEPDEEPADQVDDLPEGDDPDEDLDWPNPEAVAAWIEQEQPQKAPPRLLLGQPIGRDWLERVLRDGPQPQRQLAAWLRFRDGIDPMPFPVSAPAGEQRAKLPARPADVEPLG
ncbi:MAG: HEAT repeat domain-containing protein [Deltaproteobacteria bacterium]|nr:HEAT repeat domain-containing protein [Deltaproteobacteria bacterium]